MPRRVADFRSVEVTVPESTDIIPDKWYLLDGYVGPAMMRVTTGAGVTSKVVLEQDIAEYELEAADINVADAFALGDDVYFETTTSEMRSVAHGAAAPANSRFLGRVTVPKDVNDAVWFARLRIDT